MHLPVSSQALPGSIRPRQQNDFSPPIVSTLSMTIGIVLFNNSLAELRDFARTLHRAIARLREIEAQATPPRSTVISLRLHNNGDVAVDPAVLAPDARLTSSPSNLGFARSHNLLMAEAFAEGTHTDFYLVINPDGMLHPEALVEMVAAARRYGGRALVEAAQFPEELPKTFDALTFDTPWACAYCLLVPAAIYDAVGGFDENLFIYCEDVDLSWRARAAGYAVRYAPRALFHHCFNRPGTNNATRRWKLDSARYLAAKWGADKFMRELEGEMVSKGWQPTALPASLPPPSASSVADFSHGLNFAPLRWNCPDPIPVHTIARHAVVDCTIDVVVRFHDVAQIGRLSRCLFSLYGQRHQPIQILLMLYHFGDADVVAVEACVDAFDWSAPRRRPIVSNVRVPQTGDHRSRLWNAGVDAGEARYLGFLDFDDVVYSAGYSYLLHRLQRTGAAAAFASALVVDCTPMQGFDFVFAKYLIQGEDRYDFFLGNFCQPNSFLVDRSLVSPEDLRTDESLSKAEDYRVLATIVSKYDTDWLSVGTAISEYNSRTDGSNTFVRHGSNPAVQREWNESDERVRQFIYTLSTTMPVKDIARMRSSERSLRRELADLKATLALEREQRRRMYESTSWRVTGPLREAKRLTRRLHQRLSGKKPT
jgi:GT2 family glycosyltransferase